MTASHPSFIALDRLAQGGSADAALRAHVAACAHCRTHLATHASSPEPHPGLAAAARARSERSWFLKGGSSLRARRWFIASGGLAAVGLVALFAWRPTGEGESRPGGYVGSKGGPSVWIYVMRGSELSLWDGREAVGPGDRVRIKVDPQGYARVQVFREGRAVGKLERLYADALDPARVITLPPTWAVDEAPEAERLVVIFSQRAIAVEEAERVVARPPEGLWMRRFVLTKTAAQGSQP
jgi:hypothetical protein